VTPRHRPPSGVANADRRLLAKADAEQRTGISHQQVSKWRRRLAEPDRSALGPAPSGDPDGLALSVLGGVVHAADRMELLGFDACGVEAAEEGPLRRGRAAGRVLRGGG